MERHIKKQGKQYRASLGYAPQQQWLYDDFRVTEYLHYMASLKNVPRREQRTRIDELLEQMNLEYARHQKIKTLFRRYEAAFINCTGTFK